MTTTNTTLDTLRAGLGWLFTTRQPAAAVAPRAGAMSPPVAGRRYQFYAGAHAGVAVLTVHLADPVYPPNPPAVAPLNPLPQTEATELAEVVERVLGVPVYGTWPEAPDPEFVSVGLARPPHPTLLAAIRRGLAGCLAHERRLGCDCGWRDQAAALTVAPAWPTDGAS